MDTDNNLYVVGNISPAAGISANDFPTVNPIQATYGGGSRDGFLSVVNSAGSSLLFSTYLGGNGDDFFQSLKLEAGNGDVYLSYFSDSDNFSNSLSSPTPSLEVTFKKKGKIKLRDIGEKVFFIFKLVEEIVNDPSVDPFFKMVIEEATGIFIRVLAENTTGGITLNHVQADSVPALQPQALGGLDVKLSSFDQNLNVIRRSSSAAEAKRR